MRKLLIGAMVLGVLAPLATWANAEKAAVPDSEIMDRSLNRKFMSMVLYSDGMFERRATFFPKKNGKHWSTTSGTWAKQSDGGFCLKRKGNYFHDKNSTRTFSEGSCFVIYRSNGGKLRVDMKHAGGGGFDGPFDVAAANDNVHFPSAKALKTSGARAIPATAFLKAAQGKTFAVNQWLGLANFRPSGRNIFQVSDITSTSAVVVDACKKTATAEMRVKGNSLCTKFEFKNLWANGCGTIWQDPKGRFYVVSDTSGFAYMGGQLQ